jgi:hypothetical protein
MFQKSALVVSAKTGLTSAALPAMPSVSIARKTAKQLLL